MQFTEIQIKLRAINEATSGVNAALRDFDRLQAGAQRVAGGFNKALSLTGLGPAFAVTTIADAVSSSLDAYAEQEQALARLSDALRVNGEAVELNRYQNFADEIQRASNVADETINHMQALGVTIAGLTGEVNEKAITAAIGLSKAYKIDVEQAMMLVSKAAIGNTTALGKLGFAFDANATAAEKYQAVIEKGNEQYNAATSRAKTFSEQLDGVKTSAGELAESIGKIASSISRVDGGPLALLKETIDSMNEGTQRAIKAWENIKNTRAGTAVTTTVDTVAVKIADRQTEKAETMKNALPADWFLDDYGLEKKRQQDEAKRRADASTPWSERIERIRGNSPEIDQKLKQKFVAELEIQTSIKSLKLDLSNQSIDLQAALQQDAPADNAARASSIREETERATRPAQTATMNQAARPASTRPGSSPPNSARTDFDSFKSKHTPTEDLREEYAAVIRNIVEREETIIKLQDLKGMTAEQAEKERSLNATALQKIAPLGEEIETRDRLARQAMIAESDKQYARQQETAKRTSNELEEAGISLMSDRLALAKQLAESGDTEAAKRAGVLQQQLGEAQANRDYVRETDRLMKLLDVASNAAQVAVIQEMLDQVEAKQKDMLALIRTSTTNHEVEHAGDVIRATRRETPIPFAALQTDRFLTGVRQAPEDQFLSQSRALREATAAIRTQSTSINELVATLKESRLVVSVAGTKQ